MENGYRILSDLPSATTPDYESFLFHDRDHLRLQANDWAHFYLLKKDANKTVAEVSFSIQNELARSPANAPFGSYLYSARLAPHALYNFIKSVEEQLKKRGARGLRIVEPPLFYRASGETLHTILLNLGYTISDAEICAGIRIDKGTFVSKIDTWEKRKFRQAREKGVKCRALPFTELENVYDFILACRKERGHELSMSFRQLHETAHTFKKNFILHGAFLKNTLVAASIAIRVSHSILYNFYSGHPKKLDTISPVVVVIDGLYKFCKIHRIKLLDLGTSAQGGQPNFNLLEFKLRLGAIPSMKLTFEKELA